MAADIDVAAVTALLSNKSIPIELRNEIVNDWVMADPGAKDTWGPLVESNNLTLTGDATQLVALSKNFPGLVDPRMTGPAEDALARDVATANTVAGAAKSSAALAGSSSGASTSDELLDQASEGLRYFEIFLPLYARVENPGVMSRDAACARYDESRDMSFAALRADAATVTEAAAYLEPEHRCIDNQAQHLAASWKGAAATAATTYLGTFGTEAAQVRTWLTGAASALSQGADQLEASVRAKAVAVSGLYTGQVGGKTPDQIDTVISVMRGNPFNSDNDGVIKGMAQWFPGISVDEECIGSDLKEEVRFAAIQACSDFVEQSFTPAVENTWKNFTSTCDICDTAVQQIYKVVTDTLAAVDPAVFAPLHGGVPPTPHEKPDQGKPDQGEPDQDAGDTNGSVSPTPQPTPPTPATSTPATPTPATPTPATPTPATPMPVTAQSAAPEQPIPPVPGTGIPSATPTAVPAGLPTGAGWVSDPSSLPQGWTIDPSTGELLAPSSPGGTGDPEVHSAAAHELLDGDGKGDLGSTSTNGHDGTTTGEVAPAGGGPSSPAPGTTPIGTSTPGAAVDPATGGPVGTSAGTPVDGVTGSAITVVDHGVSMQISADDAAGPGAHIEVTDASGQATGYRVEIGADGQPHLVPDATSTPPAGATPTTAEGATPTTPATGATPAGPVSTATPETTPAGATPTTSAVTAVPVVAAGADSVSAAVSAGSVGGSVDGGPAAGVVDASASAAVPVGAEAGVAAPGSAGPVAAQVHSASDGGSWFDPGGSASGAQLASTQDPATAHAGSAQSSGAVLAGTDHDSTTSTGGGGSAGMAGMGGAGAAGGDAQEHHVADRWHVLADTFDDDDGTWASLADVLGHLDRQSTTEQESR